MVKNVSVCLYLALDKHALELGAPELLDSGIVNPDGMNVACVVKLGEAVAVVKVDLIILFSFCIVAIDVDNDVYLPRLLANHADVVQSLIAI